MRHLLQNSTLDSRIAALHGDVENNKTCRHGFKAPEYFGTAVAVVEQSAFYAQRRISDYRHRRSRRINRTDRPKGAGHRLGVGACLSGFLDILVKPGETMALTHHTLQSSATRPLEPFVELKIVLPSELSAVSPFIDQAMRFIAQSRICDGSEVDIEIALREALLNAMIHGNGQDPGARVFVVIRCSADGEVLVTIRDQGKGFDCGKVPDPTAPENRMSTNGRGIYLMRACMDEVWFEEAGTVVGMRKNAQKRSGRNSSFVPTAVGR
jgi:serine/threonine-protein kinase RsbW